MSFNDLKHAQRERLVFLDQCFTWRGKANRRDLIDRFGVSPAQAALDFKAYLAEAGDQAPQYDSVRKVYLVRPEHRALAPESVLDNWADILKASGSERFDELPSLVRRSDPRILAMLSRTMESRQAILVQYISMTTGDQLAQWIAPTRFASDGSRIHLRAYSFKHGEYRDYVPSRIDPDSSFKTKPLEEPLPPDRDWHTIARITLKPRQNLSNEQAAAVRREYAFDGDVLIVEVRKALEFYADRRWGLDRPEARLERVRTEYLDEVESGGQADFPGNRS
jgi:predicted DNA-binding transcriptional regulator YafY